MIRCPRCGAERAYAGAQFCDRCGGPIPNGLIQRVSESGELRTHPKRRETPHVERDGLRARIESPGRSSLVSGEMVQSAGLIRSKSETHVDHTMSAEAAVIEARELSKVFGSVVAVDKVSFKIRKGELFSFLGPNGAGKTTLLRLLSCVLKPSSGTASVLGHDVRSDSLLIRRRIGVIPQWPSLYMDLNAVENLNFFARLQGVRERELGSVRQKFLDLVQLNGREKKLVGTYSGGMMRRLSIACALVHRPSIVFFDEPTSGLDPQTKRIIWKLMKDLTGSGVTVILNTHYMEEADQLSDRVAIIDHGKVIAIGTIDSLKEMARPGAESKMSLEDVFIELTGEQLRE
jgi:ABC-2 type transport system ATP-binding protein